MISAGPLLLAIDQGTTNTKAILVDAAGQVIARASAALNVTYPQPSWVEQDALAIWQSVLQCIDTVLAMERRNWARREGCRLPWAFPISASRWYCGSAPRASRWRPCVVWQCQRGYRLIEELKGQGLEADVHSRTGLTLDPMFSASKMCWLLDNVPGARRRAEQGERLPGHRGQLAALQADRRAHPRLRHDQRLAHPALQPANAGLG